MEKERRTADVVIVGGGASGLAAAVELGIKAPGLDVLVMEKLEEPGRKIRATGSGRCNISNTEAAGFSRIMEFFRRIGLVTRTYDNGLVYPYSESAADVVELLTERATALGVRFACGEELISVKHMPADLVTGAVPGSSNVFQMESVFKHRDGMRSIVTQASFVILAMGGKSGPTFGTIGDGYRIARNLGHTVVTPVPALTGIECGEWDPLCSPQAVTLAGTRTKGTVTLYKCEDAEADEAVRLFEETGEIQFTKYGLSGICVFNMTRFMRCDRAAGGSISDFLVTADLFPDGDIAEFLRDRISGAFEGEKTKDVLRSVLKDNIAAYVMAVAGMNASDLLLAEKPLADLTEADIAAISRAVHCLAFHPEKLRGWNDAQITMGGVSLDEIDAETSESLLVRGLYLTGELADRDYQCGGFNLSNAWLTGICAADDIAAKTS